jgi:hypothetical protein
MNLMMEMSVAAAFGGEMDALTVRDVGRTVNVHRIALHLLRLSPCSAGRELSMQVSSNVLRWI